MKRISTIDKFMLDDGRQVDIIVTAEANGSYVWKACHWPINVMQLGYAPDREAARMDGRRWLERYAEDQRKYGTVD